MFVLTTAWVWSRRPPPSGLRAGPSANHRLSLCGQPHIGHPCPAVADGDLITASGVAPVHFAQAIFGRRRDRVNGIDRLEPGRGR